ncbi:MAG TPA: tetratricopeptide repeat protein [Terriglobales bacterium]|nr:tetratricopeptide repeat protein [Terriglobales bacterium]
MRFRAAFLAFILLVVGLGCAIAQVAETTSSAPPNTQLPFGKATSQNREPLSSQAFERFYNMEYERSIQDFTVLYQRHPDDPDAINHLLNAVLFHELYRIGALSAGEYANDSFLSATHEASDPHTCEQIKSLVQKALTIENRRLDAHPNDVAMLYARGVTKAEFATYTALIERAWFSALRNAVSARHDHEKVLELDPNYVDAKLIVGAHNYVVGNLPWAVKTASSMVGLGGNKEKGLEYLHQAAAANGEASIDAKIVLVVFLRRERRYEEALQILRGLQPQYPHNVLFAMEEGNLLNAEGKRREAEEVYRRVWQDGRKGKYSGLHYEIAATALGDLLRSEKNFTAAALAYEQVSEIPKPDPEIAQKAALGAGEMYDLLQKRDLALKKYEAVVALDSHSTRAEIARKRIKDPYKGS